MNKKWCLLLFAVILFVLCLCYTLFMNQIDTKYAVDFADVFSTYDIKNIDHYLTDETKIVCNGKQATYAELRNNVEIACAERRYQFESSYGHGNNKFKNDIQKVTIYLFGKLNGKNVGEVNIIMNLKKIGLFEFEIDALECDAGVFEYIFYGANR